MQEIQALEEETSSEEFEVEDHTLGTPDIGELLIIQRALHVQEVPLEPSQKDQIFHTQCAIGGKVCKYSS